MQQVGRTILGTFIGLFIGCLIVHLALSFEATYRVLDDPQYLDGDPNIILVKRVLAKSIVLLEDGRIQVHFSAKPRELPLVPEELVVYFNRLFEKWSVKHVHGRWHLQLWVNFPASVEYPMTDDSPLMLVIDRTSNEVFFWTWIRSESYLFAPREGSQADLFARFPIAMNESFWLVFWRKFTFGLVN